jgi:hypothetical protein
VSDHDTSYDIRVQGHLDAHWSDWFDAVLMTHHADGTTTMRCTVQDQPELHALLAKVRDLGATLVSVMSSAPHTTDPTRSRS